MVEAEPFPWPSDGRFDNATTALVCVDFQVGKRAPPRAAPKVLAAARRVGVPVVHTREGYSPDLSDCPPPKRWRGRSLRRGEPAWEIVQQMATRPGEWVVDKPGSGAFYATELDLVLRCNGISRLVFMGQESAVGTTVREANDLGYECLIISDCVVAAGEATRLASLDIVKLAHGIFGSVATSAALLKAFGCTA